MATTTRMGRKKTDRERFNITLPRGMGEQLAEAAKQEGWDRSRLLEELARAYLKKRAKEKAEEEGR